MIFFFILISYLVDYVLNNVRRNSIMVTHGSSRLKYSTLYSILVTVNLSHLINIYFVFLFQKLWYNHYFWLLILWFLEARKSKQGKYRCSFSFSFLVALFSPFFSSLDMTHIFKDVLCLILKVKKNVYVIMCHSFFFS